MARRQWKWMEKQFDKLNKIKEVLSELEVYTPLTLRQIYYQLVGKEYIENNKSQYGMLSNLLKWARISGYISWDILEDRTRTFHNLAGWPSCQSFTKASLEYFLSGYSRDLLQTQDKYLEIWIEKDALSTVFTKVAEKYTAPVVVCRGFSSVSFLNDFKERLDVRQDKLPLVLYFGDFDPSGVEMLNAMKTTLNDELGVNGIEFKRVALLQDDIHTYKLPHNTDALKHTDTRANKHIISYGEIAVELDVLRPDILESKIKNAIEDEINIDAFNAEVEKNNDDLDKLNIIKEKVVEFVALNY